MKKVLGLIAIVLLAAGCTHYSNVSYQSYIQVRNRPEMAENWKVFSETSKHATTILMPAWCNIEECDNSERGYFFPLYYLEHNRSQNKDLFNRNKDFKFSVTTAEWLKKASFLRDKKIVDVTEIPHKKIKISEDAYLFSKGAAVSYISADGKEKKVTLMFAMIMVYSNGMFSNAIMTTTLHNPAELMGYEAELRNFAAFLMAHNTKLPKCVAD